MPNDFPRVVSGKHLDEIKSAINWALGFVFIATVLAVQGSKSFKVLDVELSRSTAVVCISLIYVALCISTLAHFERIAQYLQKASNDQIEVEMESLTSHEWIFNPFVLYKLRHPGYWGFSAFIAFFWMGLSNLFLFASGWPFGNEGVMPPSYSLEMVWVFAKESISMLPVGAVILIGYGVMRVVQTIPRIAAERLQSSAPERAEDLKQMTAGLHKAADAGIAAGGFVLIIIWIVPSIYIHMTSTTNGLSR